MAAKPSVECYVCRDQLDSSAIRGHIRSKNHCSITISSALVKCAVCFCADVRELTFTKVSESRCVVLCKDRCSATSHRQTFPNESTRRVLVEDDEGLDELLLTELQPCTLFQIPRLQTPVPSPQVVKPRRVEPTPQRTAAPSECHWSKPAGECHWSKPAGDIFNSWGSDPASPVPAAHSPSIFIDQPPEKLPEVPEKPPEVSEKLPPEDDFDDPSSSETFIEPEESLGRVKDRFTSADEYRKVFEAFVTAEEIADRQKKSEVLRDEQCPVTWTSTGKNSGELVLKSIKDVYPGDAFTIEDSRKSKVRVTIQAIGLDDNPNKVSFKGVVDSLNKSQPHYVLDYLQSVNYSHMKNALEAFATGKVDPHISSVILGHKVPPMNETYEPDLSDVEGLNPSQLEAVRLTLTTPFALIQGPPGTGKTKTAAAVVAKIHKISGLSVLVCAPSNIAVDQLTLSLGQIKQLEGKVLRVYAKNRIEQGKMMAEEFSLHKKVRARLAEKHPILKQQFEDLSRDVKNILQQANIEEDVGLIEKAVVASHPVVCITCSSSMSGKLPEHFDFVLIDEAGFASEPDTLLPMVRGCSQVVLIGDHKQLPPVLVSQDLITLGYGRSMFERLMTLGVKSVMLRDQFRMHPQLSRFPSEQFYSGQLRDGVTAEDRCLPQFEEFKSLHKVTTAAVYFQVNEEEEQLDHSYYNPAEVKIVMAVLRQLQQLGLPDTSVGVICPYEAQRAKLADQLLINPGIPGKEVEIKNVDGFQGREKDVIIFSSVRSNAESRIGFLVDSRRLNVAITRAKYGLVMVGNRAAMKSNEDWRELIRRLEKSNSVKSGKDVLHESDDST